MDLKEIKAVIDLMTKNGLTEFELEKGDVKLRVKRGPSGEWTTSAAPAAHASAGTQPLPQIMVAPVAAAPLAAAPQAAAPSASAAPAASNLNNIVSPMVGTFYRSPAPDSPPYIDVGQEVNEETVVCIIEAMKVMNEIKAEMRGTIAEVIAENGKPVQFGQALFRLK